MFERLTRGLMRRGLWPTDVKSAAFHAAETVLQETVIEPAIRERVHKYVTESLSKPEELENPTTVGQIIKVWILSTGHDERQYLKGVLVGVRELLPRFRNSTALRYIISSFDAVDDAIREAQSNAVDKDHAQEILKQKLPEKLSAYGIPTTYHPGEIPEGAPIMSEATTPPPAAAAPPPPPADPSAPRQRGENILQTLVSLIRGLFNEENRQKLDEWANRPHEGLNNTLYAVVQAIAWTSLSAIVFLGIFQVLVIFYDIGKQTSWRSTHESGEDWFVVIIGLWWLITALAQILVPAALLFFVIIPMPRAKIDPSIPDHEDDRDDDRRIRDTLGILLKRPIYLWLTVGLIPAILGILNTLTALYQPTVTTLLSFIVAAACAYIWYTPEVLFNGIFRKEVS